MAPEHAPGVPMTLLKMTTPQQQAIVIVTFCVPAACLLLYGFSTPGWFGE